MKPSDVSLKLRRIAATIDGSKKPSRQLVSLALRRVLAAMQNGPKTIMEAMNDGTFEGEVRRVLNGGSFMLTQDQGLSPGARKVPLKLLKVESISSDLGSLTLSCARVPGGPWKVLFSSEEILEEFLTNDHETAGLVPLLNCIPTDEDSEQGNFSTYDAQYDAASRTFTRGLV